MADRDVQMVRIIVGDGLPVEVARAQRHPADRAQILEAVGRDLVVIGRHHLGDARQRRPRAARTGTRATSRARPASGRSCRGVEPRIFVRGAAPRPAARRGRSSTRDRGRSAPWRSPPSPSTSREPRWRQTLGKARTSPSSPRMTMTLSPRYSRLRHSPASAISLSWQTTCGAARRNAALLRLEEFGVVIEPAGQAHAVERVGAGGDGLKLRRHCHALAISATLRQWAPPLALSAVPPRP